MATAHAASSKQKKASPEWGANIISRHAFVATRRHGDTNAAAPHEAWITPDMYNTFWEAASAPPSRGMQLHKQSHLASSCQRAAHLTAKGPSANATPTTFMAPIPFATAGNGQAVRPVLLDSELLSISRCHALQ